MVPIIDKMLGLRCTSYGYKYSEIVGSLGDDYDTLDKLVGECASCVNNALHHQNIELGFKEAFEAHVSCLHQLYLLGAAIQLKRTGYHMTKMN